jgi:hypothetical protein
MVLEQDNGRDASAERHRDYCIAISGSLWEESDCGIWGKFIHAITIHGDKGSKFCSNSSIPSNCWQEGDHQTGCRLQGAPYPPPESKSG